MATPEWNQTANSASSFGRKGRTITPAAADLDPIAKSVVMLTAGDITIVPTDNATATTLVFAGLPAGYIIPFVVRRVTACTGTCAAID
jgi:hypothetical protein